MKRAALLVAALTACSPGTTTPPCGPTQSFLPPLRPTFAVAGDLLSVTLTLAMQCPESLEPRATVSVMDPENRPVPLAEGEPTRSVEQGSLGMLTVIKVQSTLPGPYHFAARFEPNLGTVQTDVLVAENRRDAQPEVTVPAGSPLGACRHVDLSPGGLPLCLDGTPRVFDRDGGVLATLAPSGTAARSGDVVWVMEENRLSRWVETSGGFEAMPGAGVVLTQPYQKLAADPAGVFLARAGSLLLLEHPGDAGYSPRFDTSFAASTVDVLWKRGNEYVAMGGFESFSPQLCSGRFPDAGRCDFAVTMFSAVFAYGVEPAGIWTWSDDTTTFPPVRSLALRTRSQLRELPLPGGWSTVDGGALPFDTGVRIRHDDGRELLVADRQGTFALEKFPDRPVVSVTSGTVTLRGAGGELLLYRR